MASLTNQQKNSSLLTNQEFGEIDLTWDEATSTWDSTSGTWEQQTQVLTNQTKNTTSVVNQAKN